MSNKLRVLLVVGIDGVKLANIQHGFSNTTKGLPDNFERLGGFENVVSTLLEERHYKPDYECCLTARDAYIRPPYRRGNETILMLPTLSEDGTLIRAVFIASDEQAAGHLHELAHCLKNMGGYETHFESI